MRTIEAAQFKVQCLALLDELEPNGLSITRRGKPVARVVPCAQGDADLIGSLRGKIRIKGDISRAGVRWNANAKS